MNPFRKIVAPHMFSSVRNVGVTLFSRKYLLYTNTGLSTGLAISGDLLQQKNIMFKDPQVRLDYQRTTKMTVCGFLSGPVSHFWYMFLDKLVPGRCVKSVCKKVFLDQIIGSPICILLYLLTMKLMDSEKNKSLFEELSSKGVNLFIFDALLWIPAQIINFALLPSRFRVLYDNVVSLFSDMIYSFVIFDYSQKNLEQNCDIDTDNIF